MRAATGDLSQPRVAFKSGFQDINTSGGHLPPGWISSCLLSHPDLLLEGMGFPGTLDPWNTLPRWLLRKGGHTLSLWKSLSGSRTALELCRGAQIPVISHSWELLPPMLLRYPKEIRFFLCIQAGHVLQLGRKGLPQETVSCLKAAQHQFIYFFPTKQHSP